MACVLLTAAPTTLARQNKMPLAGSGKALTSSAFSRQKSFTSLSNLVCWSGEAMTWRSLQHRRAHRQGRARARFLNFSAKRKRNERGGRACVARSTVWWWDRSGVGRCSLGSVSGLRSCFARRKGCAAAARSRMGDAGGGLRNPDRRSDFLDIRRQWRRSPHPIVIKGGAMYFSEELDLAALERAELGALPIQRRCGHQSDHNEVLQACTTLRGPCKEEGESARAPNFFLSSCSGSAVHARKWVTSCWGAGESKVGTTQGCRTQRNLGHLRDGGGRPVVKLEHAIVQRLGHGDGGPCVRDRSA